MERGIQAAHPGVELRSEFSPNLWSPIAGHRTVNRTEAPSWVFLLKEKTRSPSQSGALGPGSLQPTAWQKLGLVWTHIMNGDLCLPPPVRTSSWEGPGHA